MLKQQAGLGFCPIFVGEHTKEALLQNSKYYQLYICYWSLVRYAGHDSYKSSGEEHILCYKFAMKKKKIPLAIANTLFHQGILRIV